jgi:glutamine synthetase
MNPYLAFTAMLGCALDGIDNHLQVPEPLNNINVYHLTTEEREEKNIPELPGSLSEALRELAKDNVLQEALGHDLYDAFCRAKWAEIEESRMRVTDWEVERYLETA